jgi:uncharacterized membrane protein
MSSEAPQMAKLSIADIAALAFFLACWLGYSPFVHRFVPDAINLGLHDLRVAWMRTMLRRDNRIVDSGLIGQVVHSASFFASTSLIVIGALLSLLSNVEHVQPAVEQLAFVTPIPRTVFELKIVLPLLVLIHGFVSLTWSLRQLNYAIAMIGAAPDRHSVGASLESLAQSLGASLSTALATFNTGIRAYYFAIGGLAWLIAPWALAAAAAGILLMLLWRQRFSPAARHFRASLAAMGRAHAEISAPE